jgi:hypothetical protein
LAGNRRRNIADIFFNFKYFLLDGWVGAVVTTFTIAPLFMSATLRIASLWQRLAALATKPHE